MNDRFPNAAAWLSSQRCPQLELASVADESVSGGLRIVAFSLSWRAWLVRVWVSSRRNR
jgi:hypothetical protein